MKWFAKKVFDGRGKDLKNQNNSNSYLFKIFDLVKFCIRKILSEKNGIPADGCNSQKIPDAMSRCLSNRCARNTASRSRLVNEKLTFAAYDRTGGAELRAQASPGAEFLKYSLTAVCRKIEEIVSDAQGKPLNGCTKKYCSSGSIPGAEKNIARSGSLLSSCLSDRCARNTASRRNQINKILTFAAYDKIGGVGPRSTQVSYNRKPNAIVSLGKLRLRAANCGSIILEFAICMPILIILLFYINDVVRLKRLYSQTEFVAQQMANILQNISQKREGADRKITRPDIRYAASLAYLSMFPGESRFMQQSGSTKHVSDFGYNPLGYIYYFEGNPDSTASVVWARRFHLADRTFGPSTASVDTRIDRTNVKNLKNVSLSEIYPTLKINPGDKKIIIECAVHYSQSSAYSFTDGRLTSQVSPSEAFKLRLFKLSPPKTLDGKENDSVYFHSAVIFTPKPGLFDATPPQEQN